MAEKGICSTHRSLQQFLETRTWVFDNVRSCLHVPQRHDGVWLEGNYSFESFGNSPDGDSGGVGSDAKVVRG